MTGIAPREAPIDRSLCRGTRHGTYSAYRHNGCTCPDAEAAYRRYARFQQAGRPELCPDTTTHVDARPLRRRIRALYAIGHTEPDLAARLGYTNRRGDIPIMHNNQATVYATTAEKFVALYNELRDVPGSSEHNVRKGVAFGWRTPAQWDVLGTLDDPDADASDEALRRAEAAAARRLPGSVLNPDDVWARAVCRSGQYDPELWFSTDAGDIERAALACQDCPIRRGCLRFALVSGERFGVWGGLDADTRQHVRRRLVEVVGKGVPLEGTPELGAVLDAYTLAEREVMSA